MSAVYAVVTDRIVKMLSEGVAPWRKPWADGQAKNVVSKKAYRGVNAVLLSMLDFPTPYFLTFNQARELGGSVKKGEHGFPVVYFRVMEGKGDGDDSGDPRRWAMMRYYTVFNVAQCEGIAAPAISSREHTPIAACEDIVAGYAGGPTITHGGNRACYSPSADAVSMPVQEAFDSPELYYSTLFHELGHSTGAAHRLGREGVLHLERGLHAYSKEELIAEMTAAFLCGETGIAPATLDDSASYLGGWIRVLRGDPRLAVEAASAAQKAADWIRGERAAAVAAA